MKYILIWSWLNLATGQGFSISQEFNTPEECLQKKEQILQISGFEGSKVTCLPKELN